jgi:hypothetical protein
MALSSKQCLNPSDISGILECDKLVKKLADSDENELLDTNENSE